MNVQTNVCVYTTLIFINPVSIKQIAMIEIVFILGKQHVIWTLDSMNTWDVLKTIESIQM